jgi:hypothetical protein
VVQEHIDLLGELPPEWSPRCPVIPEWFHEEDDECWPWEKRFEFDIQEPRQKLGKQVGEEEKSAFLVMLKVMMLWRHGYGCPEVIRP